jgi:hypothetical protein
MFCGWFHSSLELILENLLSNSLNYGFGFRESGEVSVLFSMLLFFFSTPLITNP